MTPWQTLVNKVKEVLGASLLPCQAYSKVFEYNNGVTTGMTPQLKHIAIKYHFFKEHVQHGEIQILRVTSQEQIADCMTKSLEKNII